MPRAFVALFLTVAAASCTDGNAPPQLVAGDFGLDQGIPDLGPSDMLPGGSCTTACDCPAGQACRMGSCQTLAIQVFCCTAMTCSGSSICEFPNGTVNQCDHRDGGAITPIGDGGSSTIQCEMNSCTIGSDGNQLCRLACGGTATCVAGGGNPHCTP
jgi:hypothetical protein